MLNRKTVEGNDLILINKLLMKQLAIMFCLMIAPSSWMHGQVDTIHTKKVVTSLETIDEHNAFWQRLYERDQAYRGEKTKKIYDLKNLVNACIYVNHHGYPAPEIPAASILPTIWIHSSYPDVTRLSFPLILKGYSLGRISEKNLRYYYLRYWYWKTFYDQGNRTKDLGQICQELKLDTSETICIDCLLSSYKAAEAFMSQDFLILGIWKDPKRRSSVRIMKSKLGEYYFHDLYVDGSYFPTRIIQDKKLPELFRNINNSQFYYGIQPNGSLAIKDEYGKRTLKVN